jgi:uncharacterized protein
MQIDRLSVRHRPRGIPIMRQTWDGLLFLHWPIPVDVCRHAVPRALEIDVFDGSAWIGVTPFTMYGVRPVFTPALPFISTTHELNVRTYVHYEGVPGVWFLSLDASNPLAVLGARLGFALPYYVARMSLAEHDGTLEFTSERTHPRAPRATFEARWKRAEPIPEPAPNSLDFFLTERYCLYSVCRGRLFRSRIHHAPWSLQRAHLISMRSSMLESHGLPTPDGEPLLHGQAQPLPVEVWPLARV